MKIIKMNIMLIALTISWFAINNLVGFKAFAQEKEIPNKIWERIYGDDKLSYEYKAIYLNSDGNEILMAITSSIPGNSTLKSNRLRLWKLNQDGEKIGDIEIKNSQTNKSYSEIKSLIGLDNGDIILIVDFVPNHPFIVKLDKKEKIIFTKEIIKSSREISIFKIISLSDDKLLLIGRESSDALVIKIDINGNIIWEKKYDRGETESFVDGLPVKDGGFVLVGNSGKYDLFNIGPSLIWIGKYDAKGEIKSEKTIKGRFGNITRTLQDGYTIVYDKSNSGNQDIWIESFDSELKVSLNIQVVEIKIGFSNFKINSLSNGDFIVVGGKDGKPWISRISQTGERIWTFWGENKNRSVEYGLISLKNVFFVPSTVFEFVNKRAFQKVRLMKFIQD